jgi:hypothetical protein
VDEQAFFMLQPEMLRESDWPEAYEHYNLFVCNPSLDAADLAMIRQDVPGAKLLAYTNAQDVPFDLHPGNPYYEALADMFPEEYCIHDLNTGEIVRIQGHGTSYAVPTYIMHSQTANALVAFHQTVTMSVPWDGFYIDQCNKIFPNHRKAKLNEITDSFDINNNQVPDSIASLDSQYGTWRPYFTTKMRQAFPNKIIIANSGGQLDDPALNGITLEGVGDRFTVPQALSFLNSQASVGVPPFRAVLWKTTPESEQPSRDLAAQMPGVYFGTVYTSPPGGEQLRPPSLRRVNVPPNRIPQPLYDEDGAPR